MSLHRRAAKRDDNERAIIDTLVRCGCSVEQLSKIDLLVERAGKIYLLEVKGKHGKLTPAQIEFRKRFTFTVVRTPLEALHAVGLVGTREKIEANARAVDERARGVLKLALQAAGDRRDWDECDRLEKAMEAFGLP